MPRPSLRENFLAAGRRVLFERGYRGAGVREIAGAAHAPQGSFTNHFRSKEDFVGEVLDRYFAYVRTLMAETLGDRTQSPRARLRRYFDLITEKLEAGHWSRGCLIGNLSLEMPTQSEALRRQLSRIFAEWREPFAACIAEAQQRGEIADLFPPHDLADVLLAGWHGAMLRMKVDRSPRPLEQFKDVAFATFLAGKS